MYFPVTNKGPFLVHLIVKFSFLLRNFKKGEVLHCLNFFFLVRQNKTKNTDRMHLGCGKRKKEKTFKMNKGIKIKIMRTIKYLNLHLNLS